MVYQPVNTRCTRRPPVNPERPLVKASPLGSREAGSPGRVELALEGGVGMRNEFTAILERDGDWYVAYCPEIPGANGQGRSKDEARASLAEAIALILED